MEIFIYLHILLKSKLLQFIIQHKGSSPFISLCFPPFSFPPLTSTNDTDPKGTDYLWPFCPTVNRHAGTVDHLARDTQIAADSRKNGSLIYALKLTICKNMARSQSEWHILRSPTARPEIPLMFLQFYAMVSKASVCFQPKGKPTLILLLPDENYFRT